MDDALRRIATLALEGLPIEAVEVTDTGVYQPRYDVPAMGVPSVATDDSHRDDHFGRAWIEVDAARQPDAILRAIKAGQFRLGFASPGDGLAEAAQREGGAAPMLRSSIGVSAVTTSPSGSSSPRDSHWITSSLTAPSHASVATRVSSGGIEPSATASSR